MSTLSALTGAVTHVYQYQPDSWCSTVLADFADTATTSSLNKPGGSEGGEEWTFVQPLCPCVTFYAEASARSGAPDIPIERTRRLTPSHSSRAPTHDLIASARRSRCRSRRVQRSQRDFVTCKQKFVRPSNKTRPEHMFCPRTLWVLTCMRGTRVYMRPGTGKVA